MGIQRLTKHLLPLSEPVVLKGGDQASSVDSSAYVSSVVIDGPSLVYFVSSRLLSWADPATNVVDAQPSCYEVSFGVVVWLLQLMYMGVTVNNICFDGALPASKRQTRLSRLERSRAKLELLRSTTQSVAQCSDSEMRPRFNPRKILSGRSLPSRYRNIPENPFMVSAVYEDLKWYWSRENISAAVNNLLPLNLSGSEDYPWASLTSMVPGEADVECAKISREAGCAVLTSDSDLLLFDLGIEGSMVFLSTMEIDEWSPLSPAETSIKALRIYPSTVTRKLGITDIRYFAYQLSIDPDLDLGKLIQLSKTADFTQEFSAFVKGYQDNSRYDVPDTNMQQRSQNFDARVSELFWQYSLPDIYTPDGIPHVYLGILNEDHSRRCAWEHGRLYRDLGYSIFNISQHSTARHAFMHEYVRRGGRVTVNRIALGDTERVTSNMGLVCERLEMAKMILGDHLVLPTSWRAFALCEVYTHRAAHMPLPNAEELRRFFKFGYMKKERDWPDFHLIAETQAVLYSLRTLKQLLEVIDCRTETLTKARDVLATLPQLHVLMRPRQEMIEEYPNYEINGFEDRLFSLWERIFHQIPQA